MTPLHWACDRGLEEMVQLLLRHEADINLTVMFLVPEIVINTHVHVKISFSTKNHGTTLD